MLQSEPDWVEQGNVLAEEFNQYLVFLKKEICHENLPRSLQEMADQGLESMTGQNMKSWELFGQTMEKCIKTPETLKEELLIQWKESFEKMKQFLDLIPCESNKFYDNIDSQIAPIHEQGNALLDKLICWISQKWSKG